MAAPTLQYFEAELDTRWEPSVTGRVNDVPQPQLALASDVDVQRLTQVHDDICFIRKGGAMQATPKSVNWAEKQKEYRVTLDFRTSTGRARLDGGRDANNDAERYGGLRGEAERILDAVRAGHKEFDWIDGYEWRPLSEDMGYGFWRGVWEVRLTELADTIDPSV